ncbi:MAG: hypothetical protein MUC77_09815 [Chromatiaceae bacterium]|jgi:hypothetical protein|nr:hypothetical protein [Chromatiaceae bacterium]
MRKTYHSLLLGGLLLASSLGFAGTPVTDNGVTTIHLDQYGGYFSARETLADLKPGTYRFVVTNKAGKVVGFQIQDHATHELLDMFPLEPGASRVSEVKVSANGFRYRCPINPTPWYEVDTIKAN